MAKSGLLSGYYNCHRWMNDMRHSYRLKRLFIIAILLMMPLNNTLLAATRSIDLHVNTKIVNFTGKKVKAIAVNNQIPGPTIHFTEGDDVQINVYNHLNQGTSIHWHGLLVPWRMDGVEHITQDPIPPGGVFHYRYTLKQSGTYWYHAHANLQEQQGVYGAYIIDPIQQKPYHYTKDFVMVLSDWSDTNPVNILANLKKEGDYYSVRFPLQPSLSQYLQSYREDSPEDRKELKSAYNMMQMMRMSPYDFSDVAYDTFLLNGQSCENPWTAQVKRGDVIRLRFINAGGSTLFRIKIPNATMQVVHVQGNDVKPYNVDSFDIAPAETTDVLLSITHERPYIIYGESSDKLGKVVGVLKTKSHQKIDICDIQSFPDPKPITMSHMGHSMNMSGVHMMMGHDHNSMQSKNKYSDLKALEVTNNPNKPFTTIEMSLSGWMQKYSWFINGVPEYRAKSIVIKPGKRYRVIFKNETMMHHPMHLHGHWMILRNGHGQYDPKLHTIDVPPNETITADFDANAEQGRWYFHCHNLFHMKSGMANIVEYPMSQNDQKISHYGMTAHPAMWNTLSDIDFGIDPLRDYYKLSVQLLTGYDYHKIQLHMKEAEYQDGALETADVDLFYWHLIDEFWAIKGGINYFIRPADRAYVQPGVGIEGVMPYFIDTDVRIYYHKGSVKCDAEFSRDTQLTRRFFVRTSIRGILATKTITDDQIGSGLNQVQYTLRPYIRLQPGLNLFLELEHHHHYGVSRSLLRQEGESTTSNTTTLGLSWMF